MSVSWRRRSKSSEPAFDFAAICSASLRRDDTAAGLRARERDLDFHVTRDKGAVGKCFPHARGTECVAEQDRVEDRSCGWGQRCHGEASFTITARLMVGGALSIMSWEGSASMSALGQKRHRSTFARCPLYPSKRTSIDCVEKSCLDQEQISALWNRVRAPVSLDHLMTPLPRCGGFFCRDQFHGRKIAA